MKPNNLLRALSLLVLLVSLFPMNRVEALAIKAVPPIDLFQLPWDQGIAWVAIDGIDNGTKRPLSSSHNYSVGGAIDFAPRSRMVTGEDTSTFWVAAAAAGTVIEISSCHMKIAHGNGWLTEYQFLGNIKVKLGDTVARNQRLGIIADGVKYKYCPGSQEINVPHLHFMLRPSMIGATFAGWEVSYNRLFNTTRFTKNGITVGLNQPLLNVFDSPTTPTPTGVSTTPTSTGTPATATTTPTGATPTGATPTGTLATSTPTPNMSPTPTIVGPYVSTSIDPREINIGESTLVTVNLNNVPPEGYTSAEFTCTYNAGLFEVSNITVASLFGADAASVINGPQDHSFIVAIAGSNGNKATTSGAVFTFHVKGLQVGQTVIDCRARVSQGNNALTEIPYAVDYLTILGSTPTPNLTPSFTPVPSSTSQVPVATITSSPAPTLPANDWLTFVDSTFGFQFQYPPQGVIASGQTDSFARIDLPFVQGTNLHEKYLEMIVQQDVNPCRSPEQSPDPGETITINGIPFLKQTWTEAAAGNHYQLIVYSTSRDNVCVSLSLVLHSLNPDNSTPTEVPFDYAAEIAVVDQIVGTYMWLTVAPTITPTFTFTPAATSTFTPTPSTTPVATLPATVTGQVLASKPVTISLYNADNSLATSMPANADGTFSLSAPAGTYSLVAAASGFLSAQASITLISGTPVTKSVINLPAGDIDNNNVINQFDVLTIGMGYNTSSPSAADLNNDANINVLDLELLAKNYLKSGALVWP